MQILQSFKVALKLKVNYNFWNYFEIASKNDVLVVSKLVAT